MIEKIPTKIEPIDSLIDGIRPSELVCITGRNGCGKSTLARNLAVNFSQQGFATLLISGGTDETMLALKLYSYIQDVEVKKNYFATEPKVPQALASKFMIMTINQTMFDLKDLVSQVEAQLGSKVIVVIDIDRYLDSSRLQSNKQQINELQELNKTNTIIVTKNAQRRSNWSSDFAGSTGPLLEPSMFFQLHRGEQKGTLYITATKLDKLEKHHFKVGRATLKPDFNKNTIHRSAIAFQGAV